MSGDTRAPFAERLCEYVAAHLNEALPLYTMAAWVLEEAGNDLAQDGNEQGAADLWVAADELRMLQAGAEGDN